MTDAAHLLSDCVGFLVGLFAVWISGQPPTNRFTYGYHRAGKIYTDIFLIKETFDVYILVNRCSVNVVFIPISFALRRLVAAPLDVFVCRMYLIKNSAFIACVRSYVFVCGYVNPL